MATIEHTPATNRQHGEAARLRREDGLTNPQIALRIGVDRSTIYLWLGATPNDLRRGRHPQAMRDKARALRETEGLANFAIGKRLGVHQDSVDRWLGPTPKHLRPYRDYSRTDFPDRARYLRYCGYSVREAAVRMGVPPSTVGQWVKGYGRYGLLD
jgi:transposase